MPTWTRREPLALGAALEVLPLLLRDGVDGHPLHRVGPDGRLTLRVAVGGQDQVLVPFTLLGPGDLRPFAQVTPWDGTEERTVLALGDAFHAAPCEAEWDGVPGLDARGRLGLLAMDLLGMVHHDGTEEWGRDEPVRDWPHGRLSDLASAVLPWEERSRDHRGGHAMPWPRDAHLGGRGRDLEGLRGHVETVARSMYAFDGTSIVHARPEPRLVVSQKGRDRVVVEVDGEEPVAHVAPSKPMGVVFGLDRAAEAMDFAEALARRVGTGRARLAGTHRVIDPSLARLDGWPVSVRRTAEGLVRMVERVGCELPPDAVRAVMALSDGDPPNDRIGRFRPTWDEARGWGRAWERASDLLGDTSVARVEGTDPAWARRFHVARVVLDLLTFGDSPEPGVVPAPETMGAGPSRTVDRMGELLGSGGDAFGARWSAARSALDAQRVAPSPATLASCRLTIDALARCAPEGFPSEEAAVRWAMVHRPALREAVADPASEDDALADVEL